MTQICEARSSSTAEAKKTKAFIIVAMHGVIKDFHKFDTQD